jgi:hypothetical protein
VSSGTDGVAVASIVVDGAIDADVVVEVLGTVNTVDGAARSPSPAPHPRVRATETANRVAAATRARGDTGRD